MLNINFQKFVNDFSCHTSFEIKLVRGTWVAQLVKRLTLAQVMISQFVSSSPTLGSVLTARSQEPASDYVSPSLCPSPTHTPFLSKINKTLKKYICVGNLRNLLAQNTP